ncbi:hypothetical protein D0864_03772 [Hortaea werneckii]|uniref:Exonuclease domain-containing protein n=1 Tax=Hortaea werneckii TaxID=91943 RepID=A0A3M7GGG4_HORWE|nr:hypothetical protein KC319_g5005 [Hortaea werneckii]RMZ00301.1 hypothetical protein D0864_03772 [Hortaea werneckii]
MAQRKRSRGEYEGGDNQMGMGETLSTLRGNDSETPDNSRNGNRTNEQDEQAGGDWEVAESRSAKRLKKLPKKESGNYPAISHSSHARLNSYVKLGDLQNLALYLLADGTSPQWVSVKHHANVRKVVALMVPGLEAGMFNGQIPLSEPEAEPANGDSAKADSSQLAQKDDSAPNDPVPDSSSQPKRLKISPDDYYPVKLVTSRLPETLQPLGELFDHIWPIRTPGEDKNARMHSPLAAFLTAPILKSKEEKKSKGPHFPTAGRNWVNNRTPVTEFLASTEELFEEGYVLHPAQYNGTSSASAEAARREANKTTAADGWIDTPGIATLDDGAKAAEPDNEKGSITAGRKVLTMDCEMCITSPKGVSPQSFSLTRISIIDWDGKTVMDEFVMPENPITDYLTPYSGITPAMLEGVTTSLADIQKKLLSILTPQTILVGHSLNSDLNALKITHPYIIDTALLYPHPRGPPLKSSLKWLAQKYLSREIQKGHGSTGHDSVEDAKACLDLVKQKCEKGKAWGTSEASGEPIFKRLGRSIRPKRDKVNPAGDDEPRIGAVVDWGEPARGYGSQAKVTIGCESDEEVVKGVMRTLEGDADETVVPKGGCDFIWARFRELEAHRGWWNRSKLVDTDALRSNSKSATSEASLKSVVADTVKHVTEVYQALPPCTAFVVYSGSGDPRELSEMQSLQQKFKQEYRTKKWDELSVQWTDVEEQKLRKACERARKGVGFIAVK